MNPWIRVFLLVACMTWSASASAQNQPAPSGEDAERNAFQTPTTGGSSKQGEPGYSRDKNPLAGSQGPGTNQEGKNATEPTGRPNKASPNSPDK